MPPSMFKYVYIWLYIYIYYTVICVYICLYVVIYLFIYVYIFIHIYLYMLILCVDVCGIISLPLKVQNLFPRTSSISGLFFWASDRFIATKAAQLTKSESFHVLRKYFSFRSRTHRFKSPSSEQDVQNN